MSTTSQNTFKRQSNMNFQNNRGHRNHRNQRNQRPRNNFKQPRRKFNQPEEKRNTFVNVGPHLRRMAGNNYTMRDELDQESHKSSRGVDGRLVVGSEAWGNIQKRFGNKYIYTPDETTPEWREKYLPKQSRQESNVNPDEEVEMLGWEYHEDQGGYFTHKAYHNKKFNYHTVRVDGEIYKLPKAEDGFKDERGLCFVIGFDQKTHQWKHMQNSWVSYWDTAEGVKQSKNKDYRLKRSINKKRYERARKNNVNEIMARVDYDTLMQNGNY